MFGLFVLCVLVLTAIFADQIAPYAYDEMDLLNAYKPPCKGHIFGTDEFGRDIFSRVVYGSRISLKVGFIAVSISVVVGGLLGAVAGYYGGWTDNLIMRAMDVIMSIPATLLAISIAAALGAGLTNLMIATGIASIPTYARIVRASVLGIKEQEFVEAARAVGTRDFTILRKHILPNCLAPIIVQATLGVAFAILTAAGLSFIGLGIEPPTPEWGAMLSNARTYIRDYSYMCLFPGLAIAITIFSLNVLGDGLRDALDPKLRQ
ncbi:MAG: ABC transporter permease [Oscillospiraceae bacterium]|nr:ABC transporter permease [Oscillospiraceae bacterium]